MSVPTWVRDEVVLAIHQRQMAEHGGGDGIRDLSLLESALARPKNLAVYDDDADIPRLAAAYAHGIAINHPFVDGNKRTAFVVCRAFLLLNGHDFDATREDKVETFVRLAAGQLGEEALADWIRERLR